MGSPKTSHGTLWDTLGDSWEPLGNVGILWEKKFPWDFFSHGIFVPMGIVFTHGNCFYCGNLWYTLGSPGKKRFLEDYGESQALPEYFGVPMGATLDDGGVFSYGFCFNLQLTTKRRSIIKVVVQEKSPYGGPEK
jgi:hypothetical protein